MVAFWLTAISVTAIFLGIFSYSFKKEPRRLINGFWLNCFILLCLLDSLFLIVQHENPLIYSLLVIIALLVVFIFVFGLFILIGLLFWNSKIVRKREDTSIANLLTFILALALSGWLVFSWINFDSILPAYLNVLLSIIPITVTYLICSFFNYCTASVAYLLKKKKYDQDYLLILGSGLIDGERVSPLLASRINRGIRFYEEQRVTGKIPKFVFSGGQGADEKISEAEAMQAYATEKGIPIEDTLIENQSVNTRQNMAYSKKIMLKDYGNEQFKSVFFTNSYHVFRASLFAKVAGLNAQGIGSKTAFYFLPNALLREFVGVLSIHKKRHLYVFLFIFGLIVAEATIMFFF